jgi:streptogramin lyase
LLTGVVGHILPVHSQLNSGDILVTDPIAGTGGQGALFRVDPITGERTLLSDFGVGANQGENPAGVAVEASGNILVADPAVGGQGVLFRVDPITGERTVLSDFDVGPNEGENPFGVAVEASGSILVIDFDGLGLDGVLFRVDPITGDRTVLSDFGFGPNQGIDPRGVAVYPVIPAPVGGVVTSINKLAILAPYIALAGLIIAISAIEIKKRK